jgi:hypothetical protein
MDENPYESPKTAGEPARKWSRGFGCGLALLVALALVIAMNLCHAVVTNLTNP